jgi:serralysin
MGFWFEIVSMPESYVNAASEITADGDVGPQAYLNGDERLGANVNGKASFTIDRAAVQLTGFSTDFSGDLIPARGWSSAAGQPFTVTYGFRSTQPFDMPDDTAGFSRFNAQQIQQAEQALAAWSDVANITFVRVGSGLVLEGAYTDNAAILFGNYSSGSEGASAFANFPGSTASSSTAGDVWINSTLGSNSLPTNGNYGGQVLIHEIGHAIGLRHPGSYNAGEGQTITYAASAEYYEDSRQYTVMSYFSETNTGGNFQGRYSAVPLLDDIAAAQVEYGVNAGTRTGDTVYGFNSNADRDWFKAPSPTNKLIFAVWDAGGRDTFDFSGYAQNGVIDLREGNFSSVGGLTGNVAVAHGAVIENAIGGNGTDLLTGNAQDNSLIGGNGADTIYGGSGNDTVDGGEGGGSYLRGEAGDDSVVGGSGFDNVHGNIGNDTVRGGGFDDWVVGGQGNDMVFGDDGSDLCYGQLGDDTIDGGFGNDAVVGGQANDSLSGGGGDDFLTGDRGDDVLTGGTGADTIHINNVTGIDRITDFNAAEGDHVLVDVGSTYTLRQLGADAVVDMGGGNQLTLQNVTLSTLAAGWITYG